MVETFFERSCTINRLRQGPLAGHIDLLADRFAAHGFSRVHSRIQIRLVGHFNRWLDQKGLSAQQIDEALIERYWRNFQRRKRVRWFDVGALVRLLDLLREKGVTPQRTIEAVPTPRETLLEEYRCYLRDERGLSQGTARIVLPFVDRFLARRFPRHHLRIGKNPLGRRARVEWRVRRAKHANVINPAVVPVADDGDVSCNTVQQRGVRIPRSWHGSYRPQKPLVPVRLIE